MVVSSVGWVSKIFLSITWVSNINLSSLTFNDTLIETLIIIFHLFENQVVKLKFQNVETCLR